MNIDIEEIYPSFLYSVKYDDKKENEYDRLLSIWNDLDFLLSFFEENKVLLQNPIWKNISNPEAATKQVLKEAKEIENLIEDLIDNADNRTEPDLDGYFKPLGGDYKYELRYEPYKAYGTYCPSLIRLYAIKLDKNTYLITDGGIKLTKTIQTSPDIKDHVLNNISRVRAWLKTNGIIDKDDLLTD